MGNANGREEGPHDDDDAEGDGALAGSNGGRLPRENHAPVPLHALPGLAPPSEPAAGRAPPPPPPLATLALSPSPLAFVPQSPTPPFQRSDGPATFNQNRQNESQGIVDNPSEGGIPTIIAWQYGGNDVVVEGSWDNWGSRRRLQRSGKDHSILMVLPSGVYHYKLIVDGQWRYSPDLPHTTDEIGQVCNILKVDDYVPEILDSVAEFEVPSSPDSSYSQVLPAEEDFAKEPVVVPSQLRVTVLDTENADETAPLKPQHVLLNHLFLEKGRTPQSVVALGLTHRFQSKYVTVVLYKQLRR
ncbi:hypothetical protein BT93_J0420 [Corymbia citriodora subsp. variegata]|nr:hypothetical protein BT93_J0420 [Corymbia citriodora subsp. variegata]